MFTSAVLWGLWKLRNFVFFRMVTGEMSNISLLRRISELVHNWPVLFPEEKKQVDAGETPRRLGI